MVLILLGFFMSAGGAVAGESDIVVYRSKTCGCCAKWLKHLEENNFKIKDVVLDEVASVKERYGVPKELASCHTAVVDGYVIEGHVPADDIKALLKSKPEIKGITVPGMPVGTPGMEMGGRKDPYSVIAFDERQHIRIFNSYEQD